MLARVVDEAAERFGDRTAYQGRDSLSYEQLARRSDRVAVWLLERGIEAGDVVALVMPPSPDYVVAYAGAAKIGAITAGVNHRLTDEEQQQVLAKAGPSLVLRTGDLDAAINRSSAGRPPPLDYDPDRPVAIVFTSGTTGTPKGAVFAGRQLEFITQTDTGGNWDAGGAQLAGTSFAHVGPMTKLPGNLMRGGTIHLVDRWRAADALALTERLKLTAVAGIPTQIALMLRQPDFDEHDLASVRAIVMGGGPATPALVREARRRFAAPVAVRYSCTEAGVGLGTAFDAPPEDAEVSVGRPHAGVTLSILDEHLEPVAPGEVGEVCLRSPAAMTGYWRDAVGTAEAFTPDGSVRTGDLGWIDEAGRLRLAGRTKEMYVRGGYNVFPVEVEAVLAEHPGVADVAVVPRSDDVMGEIGVAVVVPTDPGRPPALDELREFAAVHLARHKLPEAIVTTSALPLTAMEKVDRRALARQVKAS
jgi:acyl-CoA synthetase (AMP-forming)/AMP-acid ligase II